MNFLDATQKLYNGDVLQAKLMLLCSIICFVVIFIGFRTGNAIFKGTIIPVFIIAALYAVFGVLSIKNYQNRIDSLTERYETSPQTTLEQEHSRAEKEIAGYNGVITKTWPIIMIVGLVLFLVVTKDFVRGLGLGLMLFSLLATIGDLALQTRLEQYLDVIRGI